jgi:hypothetical protein
MGYSARGEDRIANAVAVIHPAAGDFILAFEHMEGPVLTLVLAELRRDSW